MGKDDGKLGTTVAAPLGDPHSVRLLLALVSGVTTPGPTGVPAVAEFASRVSRFVMGGDTLTIHRTPEAIRSLLDEGIIG